MGLYKETNVFTQEDKCVCLIPCIWCLLYIPTLHVHSVYKYKKSVHICIYSFSEVLLIHIFTFSSLDTRTYMFFWYLHVHVHVNWWLHTLGSIEKLFRTTFRSYMYVYMYMYVHVCSSISTLVTISLKLFESSYKKTSPIFEPHIHVYTHKPSIYIQVTLRSTQYCA